MAQSQGFSVNAYLAKRIKSVGRSLAYVADTPEAHRTWRRKLLRELKRVTGYDTMQKCPLKPREGTQEDCGDYLRQRVVIDTEPGISMPFFVLTPKNLESPAPAVVTPHGHGSGGKLAVAGIDTDPKIADTIKQHNYDYGVQFVREGFVAFCPDARGFGERREKHFQDDILKSSCLAINNMAIPLGQTVAGMWAWDIHRLIDYIETRKDCDSKRIGCAGLSGGGLQTLWSAALDTRIKCAVTSGYFYGVKEALMDFPLHCSCNFVPNLYQFADMGDIAALISPRPFLVETGNQDWLNGESGVKNVKSQVRITRKAYKTLDVGNRIRHHVFEGGHRWHGGESIPWMKRWLGMSGA